MKKGILIVVSFILLAIMAIIISISPITKYLIEKYDEELTGRQIKLGWVYVNPFTGYVHISNLRIYESKRLSALTTGDSVFFSAKGVSANFSMLKLLSKIVEISELRLDRPGGIIIQSNRDLNFNDLIVKFTPVKKTKTPPAFRFNVLRIIS